MNLSKDDVKRLCDPRRVVRFRENGLSRRTAFDGTVCFGSIGLVVLAALLVIGAPFSSLFLVGFCFLALIGLAAREYVADLAAGALLHLVEPYRPGDLVHLYRVDDEQYVDATVVRLGALHTRMASERGEFDVPNHALLVDRTADRAA